MSTLNFPPTSGQPTDGSFTYAANGILYVWDGEKWAAYVDSTAEGDYVEKAGDNMTGDLTLGTDKITLDATDGNANFADKFLIGTAGTGTVNLGSTLDWANSTGDGVYMAGGGKVAIMPNAGAAVAFQVGFNDNETVKILGDGSSEFAGDVTMLGSQIKCGNFGTRTTVGAGTNVFSGSKAATLYVKGNDAAASAEAIVVQNGDDPNSDVVVSLNYGGGAEFAGVTRIGDPDNADPTSDAAAGVRISNAGLIKIKKSAGGSAISVVDEDNETNVLIGTNGNGEFAGGIQSGGNSNGGAEAGVRLRERGLVQASATKDQTVWTGYTTGTSASTSTIYGDGTATFAGNVTVADYDSTSDTTRGSRLGNGSVSVQRAADQTLPENQATFTSFLGNTPKARIFADGSAVFAGDIDAGDVSGGAGARLGARSITSRRDNFSTPNQVSLNAGVGGQEYSIVAFPTGTSDITFGVKRDGSATFTGEVVSGAAKLVPTGSVVATRSDPGFDVTTGLNFGDATKKYSIASYDKSNINDLRFYVESSGTAFFKGNVTSNGTIGFNLEPDNDANYTAEGVYNGPTLDVKERLTSMRETFQELQVAVQNATDFGALKAAMLVALEDYSS